MTTQLMIRREANKCNGLGIGVLIMPLNPTTELKEEAITLNYV